MGAGIGYGLVPTPALLIISISFLQYSASILCLCLSFFVLARAVGYRS